MSGVIARLRVGQRVIRAVACDRQCGALHLSLEVVEDGQVTYIGQIHGENTEALLRSGRLLRVVGHMIHGEAIDASILLPDKDDNSGVLPGTATIEE